jgi:hypothetical protein
MKKWSISLIVVSALGIAAFALPAASSAATTPCPAPYEPYKQCEEKPKEPPKEETKTCAAGQVGTYPNCVTPVLDVGSITVKPNSSTITLKINAAGTVKVSGKGIKTATVKVSPGNVKITVKLTSAEKKILKKKGTLKLKVTITYTPTGGSPITKTVKVTIKSPASKH